MVSIFIDSITLAWKLKRTYLYCESCWLYFKIIVLTSTIKVLCLICTKITCYGPFPQIKQNGPFPQIKQNVYYNIQPLKITVGPDWNKCSVNITLKCETLGVSFLVAVSGFCHVMYAMCVLGLYVRVWCQDGIQRHSPQDWAARPHRHGGVCSQRVCKPSCPW